MTSGAARFKRTLVGREILYMDGRLLTSAREVVSELKDLLNSLDQCLELSRSFPLWMDEIRSRMGTLARLEGAHTVLRNVKREATHKPSKPRRSR